MGFELGKLTAAGVAAAGLLLAAGCQTYPYATAFAACDAQAGACYRSCEAYGDERDYVACQADCEAEVDRCFDAAYSPYGGTAYYGAGYGYGSPWYGRWGAWHPGSGYVLSLDIYNRYGYRSYRPHRHGYRQSPYRYDDYSRRQGSGYRDRSRDGDRGGRDRPRGGDGAAPPPVSQPPSQPPARPPRSEPPAERPARPASRPRPGGVGRRRPPEEE